MSHKPKKVPSTEVFQNCIKISNPQTDKPIPKEEEKDEKSSSNSNNLNQANVLPTQSSSESEHLNTSININFTIPKDNKKNKINHKNKIYSFIKEYCDELLINLLLEEKNPMEK